MIVHSNLRQLLTAFEAMVKSINSTFSNQSISGLSQLVSTCF